MPELLRSGGDNIVVQVQRRLHDQSWWFQLEIPQEFWEDLFNVNGPQPGAEVSVPQPPRMTMPGAYERARPFWDSLAERNADALEQSITGPAPHRHLPHTWPDLPSLQRAYDAFNSE